MVVAKLDAVAVQRRLGDLPQNVNFAIKATVARTFLEAHRIAVQGADISPSMATEDLHDKAQTFTVALFCMPVR